MMLSDQQWKQIEDLFPAPPRRKDGRGRPWASNRSCFEGILWVLRVGARWRDLPSEYPHGSTCWRRLRRWEEQGAVSYTHLRAHETDSYLVCRLLLEKKKRTHI